ncbi:MAG: porin [Moraxella osloensis]
MTYSFDYDNVGLGNLMVGEQRANNVIVYKSPTLVGMPVTFMAAVGLSENDNDANKSVQLGTTATTTDEAKEKDNAYSASLAYDQNGVYLAAGYDKNTGQYKEASPLKNAAFVDNAWRLVGALDMGKMNMVQGLTLGALYQDANIFKSPENEKSWLLSAKYKVGETPWAVKAQYINSRLIA